MGGLETYVITFNCGRDLVKPEVFAQHLFNALDGAPIPTILVISLQEVAPIAYSFLGRSLLEPYFQRVRDAVNLAIKASSSSTYVNLITRNVGMTAIMAFVLQNHTRHIAWIETAGVGVGVHEMGNKGAVGIRFGYSIQEEVIELTFVAAHLAPMEDAVERRNEDWKNIVRGLVFTPPPASSTSIKKASQDTVDEDSVPLLSGSRTGSTTLTSGMFSPTSHLLFAGDLNYRTSGVGPSPNDYQVFPQPTQDTTDSRHYSNLLKEDQLSREMKAQKTCHGLQEAAIDFPPTYKYSEKGRSLAETSGDYTWYWSRHRWPSWCDRILYLATPSWLESRDPSVTIQIRKYIALPLMSTSDHRPVAMSFSIPLQPITPPEDQTNIDDVRLSPPFAIDPAWTTKRVTARRKEVVVGLAAYLTLTWDGRVILIAMVVGIVGGWLVISSLFRV